MGVDRMKTRAHLLDVLFPEGDGVFTRHQGDHGGSEQKAEGAYLVRQSIEPLLDAPGEFLQEPAVKDPLEDR